MPGNLTDLQAKRLKDIEAHWVENFMSPTIREMSGMWGGIATNAVSDTLRALARKGFIKWVPVVSRGVIPLNLRIRFVDHYHGPEHDGDHLGSGI